MHKTYYVYMMSSNSNKALYIGVTDNIVRRVQEHKNGTYDGFTKKYLCHKLVYFEYTNDVRSAIDREKQLKGWRRDKKNALISRANPAWDDLSKSWD